MGVDDEGDVQGGCGCLDLGPDILGSGTAGTILRVGDVGDDPPHQRVLDRFHHRVEHRLAGRQTWKGRDDVWV